MASGRAADREDPGNSRRNAARSLDRDPISELHQGQRSDAPHRRAGHMTAPDHIARTASKSLARGGRSLIASPLSIASCFFLLPYRGHGSLRGRKIRRNIWFEAQALQCPQRAHMVSLCGPRPSFAAACTLAPSGNYHIRGDARMDFSEGLVRRPPAARTSGMARPSARCCA